MGRISIKKVSFWIAGVSVLAGIVGLIFAAYNIRAANLTAGPLTISYTGSALFSETNLAPGDVIVKDLTVTNNGIYPHSFSFATSNVSGDLANVIQIEPREGATTYWNETLANLATLPNGSKVVIPSIDPGTTRNLQIAAIFPSSSGNEYQANSVANFSIIFGDESTDTPEPSGFASPAGNTLGQSIANAITYNPPEENPENSGEEVSGAETVKGATTAAKKLCFWWAAALVLLLIFLYLYHRYVKNSGRFTAWWIWPPVVAVAIWVAHYYLDKSYQETIFCHWLWAIELIVIIIYYIIELRTVEE